jgi:hypothetical protein
MNLFQDFKVSDQRDVIYALIPLAMASRILEELQADLDEVCEVLDSDHWIFGHRLPPLGVSSCIFLILDPSIVDSVLVNPVETGWLDDPTACH